MKHLLPFLLTLGLFGCQRTSPTEASPGASNASPPNILLIVVDDQGYADFAPFDNHDPAAATPHMARLAEGGTVYTQAYVTAPVCSPSRVGMLTGKNQFRWDGPASWGPGLPDSVRTVAEYLSAAGYATARIGKNDLGQKFHRNDVREYPTHHGYDEFLGFSAHAHDFWLLSGEIRDRTPDPANTSAVLGPLMHNDGEKEYTEGYLTDILTDEAIDYLGRERDRPFFLTLSYNAVHHLVHEVPERYLLKYGATPLPNYDPADSLAFGRHPAGSYSAYYDMYSRTGAISVDDMRRYYLANLNALDDNVGRLLDALDDRELAENTLVVYISDNGGSPLTGANNAPLTGGKYALWEGGIRVPMAIRWPGVVAAGAKEERYVSALDVLPTLASAAGVTVDDPTLDGQSLLGSTPDPARLLVWKWQKTWAVRRGDYKLTNAHEDHWKSEPVRQYIAPIVDNDSLKLFDLRQDPGERIDLSATLPDTVAALQRAYEEWGATHLGRY